jgi:hypothetical protein
MRSSSRDERHVMADAFHGKSQATLRATHRLQDQLASAQEAACGLKRQKYSWSA